MPRPTITLTDKDEFLKIKQAVFLLMQDGITEAAADDLVYDLYRLHQEKGGRDVIEGVKHYLSLRAVLMHPNRRY